MGSKNSRATPHPAANTGPVPPGTGLQADAATGLWVDCGPGEAIRLDVVALDEGYFTGLQLIALGSGAGEVLGQLPTPAQPMAVTYIFVIISLILTLLNR